MDNDVIAKRLIELRGKIPREVVSKECGITVSALSMYENGNRIPRDEIKIKLANFYKKSVQQIFLPNKYT